MVKPRRRCLTRIQTTKVVGYFAPRDTALADFEQAAAEFRGRCTIRLGTGRCGKFDICISKLYLLLVPL